MKKIFLFVVASMLLCNSVRAQYFGIGGGFAYHKFLEYDADTKYHIGLVTKGFYQLKSRWTFGVEVIYFTPHNVDQTIKIYKIHAPQEFTSRTLRSSFDFLMRFSLQTHFTFYKDKIDYFNMYALGGIAYSVEKVSREIKGTCNEAVYNCEGIAGNFKGTAFTYDFGMGTEMNLDPALLFLQAEIGIPTRQANGKIFDIDIPKSVTVSLGMRLPFGK